MFTTLKYRLTAPIESWHPPGTVPQQAVVFLNAFNLTYDALIQYEGPEPLVSEIKSRLMSSYGFRARFIEEETSPQDLLCAMMGYQMKPFQPELIEGAELFEDQN